MIKIQDAPGNFMVPFDSKEQAWVDRTFSWRSENIKWCHNFVFRAFLFPDGVGGQHPRFDFIDATDNQKYSMSLSCFAEFQRAQFDGRVHWTPQGWRGDYTFYKQGQSYSVGVAP